MSDINYTLPNPLNSISTSDASTAQQLAGKAALATQTAANVLFSQITTNINTAAALRVKIITNTASPAEITQYNTAMTAINTTQVSLNATASVDPDAATQINNELQQQKLSRIKNNLGGSLTMLNFTDFLDYLFRTQAINPYSRERTCDIDFIDMMYNIGNDIGLQQEVLKELGTLVTDAISNIVTPTPPKTTTPPASGTGGTF